jgi:hypothetical protein
MYSTELITLLQTKEQSGLLGNNNNYYDGIMLRTVEDEQYIVFQHGGISDGTLCIEMSINMLRTLPDNLEVWYENPDNSILPVHCIYSVPDRENGTNYFRFDTFLSDEEEEE